eukprot:comp16936_c0_seq1/m.15517 comp16936_c0_seq1/g.15517  ORF comp16936_c0_seq1/g.15517 comp16936_c0_seq1/m.15517 type:complete len:445 (-) comp16936_c0_seq1:24-1358(-)
MADAEVSPPVQMEDLKAAVEDVTEQAAEKANDATKKVAETASDAVGEVAGKPLTVEKTDSMKVLKDVTQTVSKKAADAVESAKAATEQAKKVVGEKTESIKKSLKEPVSVGRVKLAPLDIPAERRMQTFAVWMYIMMLPICWILNLVCLFNPFLWVMYIPYLIFIFFDTAPEHGGRISMWFRRVGWWRNFRDYFPAQLIKDEGCELDPKKNYIFGYHPHGIISLGAVVNFATEANKFSELFPGIILRVCTLVENFRWPFFREFLMALGIVPVSRRSIINILRLGPGNSAMIVIGGAAEALDARPKTADIVLERRKGFIKIALQNGASVVPVFCFGENDVYRMAVDNTEGTQVRKTQDEMLKKMGFSMPIFHGRGVFNYSFGIMPVRKPLIAIVGKPVDLPHLPNPGNEDVDKYHTMYKDALVDLYNRYKNTHALDRRQSLRIVK